MIGAVIAIIVIVALEDYRESSRDHTFDDIFPDHGYWRNRWRLKYHWNGEERGPKKWWAKYGGLGTAFIDMWHAAKTIGVMLIVGHILVAWGVTLSWWVLLLAWSLYGGTHELLYNNLYKRRSKDDGEG